ncbi:hypothetical protein B7463_g1595, partial [Scytalidium lignicola]
MARGAGIALKSIQWLLRAVEFLCSVIILAIFAYFIAKVSGHNGLHVPTWNRAVEGISGAAALYTLIGLLLLCCLAGMAFFSAIAILLDILFIGAFIYLAWELRRGRSCSGNVQTPFGNGNVNQNNRASQFNGLPSLRTACRLEKACFAVALVAIAFFLFSLLIELLLIRNRRRERAFGPSPANDYTSGRRPRRSLWQRLTGRKAAAAMGAGALAAEKNPDSLPAHTTPTDVRQSYNSEATAVNTEPGAYRTSSRIKDEDPSYQKYGRPTTPLKHPAFGTATGPGAGAGTGAVGGTAAAAGAGYAGYDYASRGQDDTGYARKTYVPGGSGGVTPTAEYSPYRPSHLQGQQEYGVTGASELDGGQGQSLNNQGLYYSAPRVNEGVSPISPVAEMDTGRRL